MRAAIPSPRIPFASYCRRRDSNPHTLLRILDFETKLSTFWLCWTWTTLGSECLVFQRESDFM
jgi:hypothetical protein